MFWHARPHDDMKGTDPDVSDDEASTLPERAACDVLFVGHTHLAFARIPGRRMICNPGALLRDPAEPRHVPTLGTFGVLELPVRTFTIRNATRGDLLRSPRARRGNEWPRPGHAVVHTQPRLTVRFHDIYCRIHGSAGATQLLMDASHDRGQGPTS